MEGQSKPYRLECRAFTGVSAGARYLATVVRESSGKTPLEMIHRYTANMIAQHLRSTNLTVKEICTELEFPNESFFGRFVKKHLGCSPREYREKMRQTVGDGE